MFKVGDEITCIDNSTTSGVLDSLTIGKNYEVLGLDECDDCGAKLVLINVNNLSRKKCTCNMIPILPNNAYYAKRFALKGSLLTNKLTHKKEVKVSKKSCCCDFDFLNKIVSDNNSRLKKYGEDIDWESFLE